MHRLFATLLLLISAQGCFAQQQEITFTAGDQKWAVNSTAIAKVHKTGPFLSVLFENFTMRVNPDYKFAPLKVLNYKVGIAYKKPDGQWDILRWSEPVKSGTLMSPGQTRLIENQKAVIPIDGIPSLKDKWLVICVETKLSNSNVGTNYSHGSPGLN